jgi:hypothetical protein
MEKGVATNTIKDKTKDRTPQIIKCIKISGILRLILFQDMKRRRKRRF